MLIIAKLRSIIRTTELGSVVSTIITEFKKNDWASDLHLTGIFGLLEPKTLQLTKAINRIKAESILEDKDELRDNKVKNIYYLVFGFMHHPDEEISSAATKINGVMEHYGLEIINESYATESSLVKSLLEDLSGEELQTTISALPGLNQLLNDLRSAQTEFEEAQVLFEKEKSKEGMEENATAIKKQILPIINDKLIVYLNAMVQVDETKYLEFAGTVAQIIDDMNVIIKKRQKNSEPIEIDSGTES